ncbi:superoxide dismutase [Dactylosporangium vinaceum]|uniref:Superoxide dismutase n=1 Tax=Dactylosporangium vinaceum TaxID=53362 RepID=A0ABV5M2G6_9ACTN|nr:superoxide dismutase [Dactylosporangium vinaceum]UAB96238.1 superoxide dismutase [Dactylosporangium vinaceum]
MGAPSPARAAEAVQRAAGVIAAKARGDLDGAEALLAAFTTPAEQAQAFALLAELALGLVRAQTGQSMDDLVRELSLLVEQALAAPPATGPGPAQ